MKNKRLKALMLATFMVVGIALTGCSGSNNNQTAGDAKGEETSDSASAENKVIDYYLVDEPQTLDAQQITGEPDMVVLNMMVEGLTRFGQEEGKYEPGVATDWSFDDTSNSWTFNLRDDATWSNGEAVTAADFFFAWKIALDDNTPYSFMMTDFIKGAAEYAAVTKKSFLKEKDTDFAAILDKADAEEDEAKLEELNSEISKRQEAMTEDELTEFNKIKTDLWANVGISEENNSIKIELIAPAPFFPGLTAFPVFMPMNEKFYSEHKEAGDYTLESTGLVSNGPWIMENWQHDASFTFVKNDKYWNKDNIKIDEINLKIVTDVNTRTNLLKTGELDGSAIQASDLKEFEDIAALEQYGLQEMVNMSDYSVFFIEFNHFNNEITENVNIRKAFAYAMDRTSFVEKINLGDFPALSLIPNQFPGLDKTFREENGETLFEDNQKEEAKKYLEEGLKELGLTELPAQDLIIGSSDIALKIAQKFQEDWKEIGITVNLVPLPWGEKITRLYDGDFGLCSSGWGPDYLDAMTFLDLFQSTNGNNHGQYNNEAYDKLILAAKAEVNTETRIQYMYDAEKILIDDMVMAPQYFRVAHWTYKNYLTGVVNRGAGPSTDFYYADIDMAAKLDK
jgi:oligopeptide transport system substrate-binding protein